MNTLGKVVIFGGPQVGKTSLRNRFESNYFNPEYKPTLEHLNFRLKKGIVESVHKIAENGYTELCIWDLPGWERHRWIRNMFLKNVSIGILMINLDSKSLGRGELNELLKDFHGSSPKGHIILVINKFSVKNKLGESDIEILEQTREFAGGFGKEVIEINTRTGEGVSQLKDRIFGGIEGNDDDDDDDVDELSDESSSEDDFRGPNIRPVRIFVGAALTLSAMVAIAVIIKFVAKNKKSDVKFQDVNHTS
ncbi:MAG: GTP-binding protein [Oscillospiraceae bacterium]|nr:GTP-binding protein [Oscillospiraceae bacterium]